MARLPKTSRSEMRTQLARFRRLFSLVFLSIFVSLATIHATTVRMAAQSALQASAVVSPQATSSTTAMQQLCTQFATSVVIPGYRALTEQTKALSVQSDQLLQNPTALELEAFQAQWLQTASAWAYSSPFAFGPIDSLGYGAAIASPIDEAGIDKLLTADPFLSANRSEDLAGLKLHPSLQGLEAIAYLLQQADIQPLSKTEQLYLQRLAADLHQNASALLAVWETGWDGYPAYQTVFSTAGSSDNRIYASARFGAEEIVRGLVNNLDVLTNETLLELLEENAENPEASARLVDLQLLSAAVEGLRTTYNPGESGPEAMGLKQFVAIANPESAENIQQALNKASQRLTAAQDSTAGSSTVDQSLSAALDALNRAQSALESDVLTLVAQG